MKIPEMAPTEREVWNEVLADPERLRRVLAASSKVSDRAYLHWDKLRHLNPPEGLSAVEWWAALKVKRGAGKRQIPLVDKVGNPFGYSLTDQTLELLHKIDQRAGTPIGRPSALADKTARDRYLVSSLMEEAITSSQIEGASTTRQVAKELIRTGRLPRDRSEQMILNNYQTMKDIIDLRDRPLTPDFVLNIHRRVTEGTMDEPTAAGRLRREEEPIEVGDDLGAVFHVPPAAAELPQRLELMCDFANGKSPDHFVPPAVRSCILHFWLAYDHPFVDGNGRTARALFYWSMLRHGSWLCEFISISQIINKARAKYGRAFLLTETDDNDLTYFISYHLEVVCQAVDELHAWVERRAKELTELEAELRGMRLLNHRQQALIAHALRNPGHTYTIESHGMSHAVAYATGRSDLMNLMERGLLTGFKVGREWHFSPVADLEKRLAEMKP
jgi:Fic family protein